MKRDSIGFFMFTFINQRKTNPLSLFRGKYQDNVFFLFVIILVCGSKRVKKIEQNKVAIKVSFKRFCLFEYLYIEENCLEFLSNNAGLRIVYIHPCEPVDKFKYPRALFYWKALEGLSFPRAASLHFIFEFA